MKKTFLSVLFVSLAWAALSQSIIARSGPANTVQDARATWLYNAFLPRFADTTAANVQKGIDSCGAVIYTYDINGLWFRQCSPKKWIMLNNSSPYSSSGWNVGGNLFPVTVIPSRNIGTLAPYGGAIGLMTNSVTQMIIPDAGINRQSGGAYKYLLIDTVTRETGYGDGGGGSSSLRFGVSGEDIIATASRSFNQNGYDFTYTGDGNIKINGGVSGSTAKLQIGQNKITQFAPTLSVGTVPVNSIHSFFYFDDTLTVANNSSVPLQGFQLNRYVTQGENNVAVQFKNGASLGLVFRTKDTITLVPQGSDAVYGVHGSLLFRKRSDQTSRSAVRSGTIPGIDASAGLLGSINLSGGVPGNNFHLYGDYAAITAYNYNNSGYNVDTIDNYYAFLSYGSAQTYINRAYNYYAEGISGSADTVWGFYSTAEDFNYMSNGLKIGAGIKNSTDRPVTSAILDLTSTTRGFLSPRMTTTQRTAISSPATGLLVYDTDSSRYMLYNGAWKGIKYTDEGGGSSGADTSIYTYNGTLTGNRTLTGADNNLTFSGVGIYAITQSNKASVSGSSGTNNVAPFTLTGGNGGASSYSTGTVVGGSAGNISITGGQGGAITGTPTTGIGGTGSSINLVAGDGGLGTTNGGQGGNTEIAAGAGGAGTAGGTPGYVAIKGGFAGITGNADGGHIYLSPGAKNGSGADGHIFLGLSPSGVVRGSATIGSTTKGDSLFNIKSGGLYADRGVRFPNTPLFADTTNYKPVVMNSSGTLYKATYWPGGGGSGVTGLAAIGSSPNANGATISGSTLNLQPASASFGGVVTTGTQTMAGNKTFSGAINVTDSVYINNNTSTADKWNLRLVNSNTSGNTGIYFGSSNFSQESRIYNTSNGSMIYEGGGYNGHYFTTYNGVDRKVYGRIGQGALFSTSTDISAYAVTVNGVASTIAAIDGGGLYVGNGAVFNQNQSSSGDITIKGQTDADLTFWDVSKDEMYIGVNTSSDAGAYKVQSTTGYFGTSVTSPAFYTVGTSSGSVKLQSATGTYTLTLPTTDGNASEFLQTDGSGNLTWAAASGGGAISALTAATGSNTIDNTNYGQTWNWSTLAGNSALKLGTTSTAANGNAQRMLEIAMGGANVNPQTTYGIYSKNAHTGTGSVNVALYAEASSGATNYAIVVPSSGGYVGIGTSTPTTLLEVSGQATTQAAISGTTARFTGTDAAPLRLSFDTHNSTDAFGSQLFGRRSRGTSASPSALSAGDVLFAISGTGYGTSQYTASSTGLIAIKANQTFTNANAGTYIAMFTTPDNSVTAAEVARFNATNLTLGVTGTMAGSLKFSGSGTGVVTITTQATAGTYTLTLPNSAGSSGQYLQTDGSGGLSWQTSATGTGQTFQQVMGTTLMRIF